MFRKRSHTPFVVDILGGVVAICAVALTAVTLLRLWRPDPRTAGVRSVEQSRAIADWESLVSPLRGSGPPNAPVKVIVFSDYECPACLAFHEQVWMRVRGDLGTAVQFTHRHMPLSYHRLAMPAALAAECASQQGKFSEMHDALFRYRDSLGLVSFERIAEVARVDDRIAFSSCLASDEARQAVEADRASARRLELRGTPAIIVNGTYLAATPSRDEFLALVDSLVRQVVARGAAVDRPLLVGASTTRDGVPR